MNDRYLVLSTFILSLYSASSHSEGINHQNIPEEFKAMFDEERSLVNISFPSGDVEKQFLLRSYDRVRLDKTDKPAITNLKSILVKNNIKDEYVNKILSDLLSQDGIKNTTKCEGLSSTCVVITDSYAFFYNIDSNVLRVFLSENVLKDKKTAAVYASNVNNNNALINSSSIFVNQYDDDTSLNISDSLVKGFKYGYLRSDFNINTDADDVFDLNELSYNVTNHNTEFKAGYFSDNNSMNATDIIDSFTNSDTFDASFGSSRNLLLKANQAYKKVNIYVPSAGLLSIRKNGVYIKQYAVKAGQQEISYNDLPAGVYEINVTVKSGNNVFFDRNYNIYNIKSAELSKGDFDYRVQVGMLTNKGNDEGYNHDYDGDLDEYSGNYNDSLYSSAKLAYGLADGLTLSGALTLSEEKDLILQSAIDYTFINGAQLTYNNKLYSEGSSLNTINLYSPWINIGYEDFHFDDDDGLACFTEACDSRTNINISKSIMLTGSLSTGLYYNYYKYAQGSSTSITNNYNYDYDSSNNFNFEITYNKNDDNIVMYNQNDDEFQFNLRYTKTFGNNSRLSFDTSAQKDQFTDFTSEFDTGDLLPDDNMSLSALARSSFVKDRDETNDTSLDIMADYQNNNFDANYYASISTVGTTQQNLSLNNTQIITSDGIDFTRQKSEAYLKLDIKKSDDVKDNDSYGVLSIEQDSSRKYDVNINNDNKIVPLNSYAQYNNRIDTESSSLENTGKNRAEFFVHPGSVVETKMNLTKVVSFVSGFKDILDQDILAVQCVGEGCVDVENIDANVFKIAVRSGQPFVLKNKDKELTCLTPQVRDISVLNIGMNYCIPDDNEQLLVMTDPQTGKDMRYVYLGIFETKNKWRYASLDKDSQYNIIEKKFGDDKNLVYVSYDQEQIVSNDMKEKLSNIMLTADVPKDAISNYVLLLNKNWN
ncbi:CS1-pili formation C-terminal domain-containing protein [uncultured Photobacterium sp.]|uniref:CS1-pili formation C-terminal domain-containing protein n=1 Tax=uncultured Photobacterium sp. TaxID=173973 RepID=UPI002609FA01|nr:CS1-pili formation C-terminal domain-containing protein [uncultured Photobacterium sp.]